MGHWVSEYFHPDYRLSSNERHVTDSYLSGRLENVEKVYLSYEVLFPYQKEHNNIYSSCYSHKGLVPAYWLNNHGKQNIYPNIMKACTMEVALPRPNPR